jgi:Ca2+-binding EF-hand superfamily protein
LKTDFNLIDAFRIFDLKGLGSATLTDLKNGLNELGLQASEQELMLFMKRFDKDGDSKLRYSEFVDAFLPSDKFHGSLLVQKAPLTMFPQTLIP